MTIRFLVAALALCLGFSLPTSAKDIPKKVAVAKPAKKQSRTLQEVIEFALKEGKVGRIPLLLARRIGYVAKTPVQSLDYPDKHSEEGFQKSLMIVFDGSENPKPKDLVFGATKGYMVDGKQYYSSRTYRTSLKGDFIAGAHVDGPASSLVYTDIKADDASEMALLKSDIDYFRTKAVSYEVSK